MPGLTHDAQKYVERLATEQPVTIAWVIVPFDHSWAGAPRDAPPLMNLEPVRRVLDVLGAPYALIGAHAMAARGYPRFTVDVDLLTTDPRVLDRGI